MVFKSALSASLLLAGLVCSSAHAGSVSATASINWDNTLLTGLSGVSLTYLAPSVAPGVGSSVSNVVIDNSLLTSGSASDSQYWDFNINRSGSINIKAHYSLASSIDPAPVGYTTISNANASYELILTKVFTNSTTQVREWTQFLSLDDIGSDSDADLFNKTVNLIAGSNYHYRFTISTSANALNLISANVQPVPLPGTAWVFGSALFAFLGIKRKA